MIRPARRTLPRRQRRAGVPGKEAAAIRKCVAAFPFLLCETVLYAAFLSLDLLGAAAGLSTLFKYLSILLCFLCALRHAASPDGRLVCAALGFTLLADWFLLVLDAHYILGVACFCVVQALYLTRIGRLSPSRLARRLLVRALLTGVALGAAARLGVLDLLTALTLFYFVQLVCNALESLRLDQPYRMFTLGLFLFVGCDLCVGLHNLAAYLPVNGTGPLFAFARVGMWLFYLPSQVSITLSVRKP